MTTSGFPAGSIMDRMSQLMPEERALIGNQLASAIYSRGSATVEDFDRALALVQLEAQAFFARLHGGPFDGEELRLPESLSAGFNRPKPDREATPEEVAEARALGRAPDISVTYYRYERRVGSAPQAQGEAGDFDYIGPSS